jgi:hypothetical protein
VLLILFLLLLLESDRELKKLKLTEYSVTTDKLGGKPLGKSFIFLSDFHEAVKGKLNDRIIEKVREVKPEFILIGGDMINGGEEDEDITPAVSLIRTLSKEAHIYMASGNHEMKVREGFYGSKNLWGRFYNEIKDYVTYIDNQTIVPGELPVRIYGLDLEYDYYKRLVKTELEVNKITSLIGNPDPEKLDILLAHNPEYFMSYAGWGADIILSGHYHGGMIRLPFLGGVISPKLVLFPKYDYGCFKEKSSRMLVTSGLGQHSIKIRFNNIPEIVAVRI